MTLHDTSTSPDLHNEAGFELRLYRCTCTPVLLRRVHHPCSLMLDRMQLVALSQDLVEEATSENFTKCWCAKRITLCEWCMRKAVDAPCALDGKDPLRRCRHAQILITMCSPHHRR